MNSTQKAAEIVSQSHMHQHEYLCRQAISKYLGRQFWCESEVKQKCELKQYPYGRKVLIMDGIELLEIFPIEQVIIKTEFSQKMVFTSKFRFLI